MALITNGSSQYASGTATTAIVQTDPFTIVGKFKTGALSGSAQTIFQINQLTSNLRGYGLDITSAGNFILWRYSGSFQNSGTIKAALANTIYKYVLTRDSVGNYALYLDSRSTSASNSLALSSTLQKIYLGALYN